MEYRFRDEDWSAGAIGFMMGDESILIVYERVGKKRV